MLALALLKYFKSTIVRTSVAPCAPIVPHRCTCCHPVSFLFQSLLPYSIMPTSRVTAHHLSHLSFVPQSSHDSHPSPHTHTMLQFHYSKLTLTTTTTTTSHMTIRKTPPTLNLILHPPPPLRLPSLPNFRTMHSLIPHNLLFVTRMVMRLCGMSV